jgi:hypothetical protein
VHPGNGMKQRMLLRAVTKNEIESPGSIAMTQAETKLGANTNYNNTNNTNNNTNIDNNNNNKCNPAVIANNDTY